MTSMNWPVAIAIALPAAERQANLRAL